MHACECYPGISTHASECSIVDVLWPQSIRLNEYCEVFEFTWVLLMEYMSVCVHM